MSVLIKGMDMPVCCSKCDFHESGYPDWCNLSISHYREIDNSDIVQEWCPLSEVVIPEVERFEFITTASSLKELERILTQSK